MQHLEHETTRWVSQLIIAICNGTLGVVMLWQTYRRYGFVWPTRGRTVPWDAVVGMLQLAISFSFLAHAVYWSGVTNVQLDNAIILGALWVTTVLSLWTLVRWIERDWTQPFRCIWHWILRPIRRPKESGDHGSAND